MWQEEGDATGAMNGMYNQLRGAINSSVFFWGDLRTGFYTQGLCCAQFDIIQNTLTPSSSHTNWDGLYTTINDANLILKHVPNIEFSDESEKNDILANAHLIRALSYFYIARIWGDAPVLVDGFESAEQEGLEPTRDPVTEVFSQINDDIESALSLISESASSPYFASSEAINILKADFNLWRAKTQGGDEFLEMAQVAVNSVLQSNHELMEDYETVFREDINNEIIFSLNILRDEGPENDFGDRLLINEPQLPDPSLKNNPIPAGTSAQHYIATEEHEEFLYENVNDTRSLVNYGVHHFQDEKLVWVNKYLGELSSEGDRFHTSDIKIYRFAEAILFKAEIENELGNQSEAINELNKIAKRAYNQDNYYSGSYSKEELDEIILDERLKEFFTEGKSWFDLIRFDKAFERVVWLEGRENEQNILLWPISQTTINLNPNIEQTPGY